MNVLHYPHLPAFSSYHALMGLGAVALLVLGAQLFTYDSEAMPMEHAVDTTAQARGDFRVMDADHNGLLTLLEHGQAGGKKEDFNEADVNRNRTLSVEELTAWQRGQEPYAYVADSR